MIQAQQHLGPLRSEKIPSNNKFFTSKKGSFVIKLSGVVLVFCIVMGLLTPDFWKAWPLIIIIELCIVGSRALSLWLYERWKFKFFLYDYGIVVNENGIDHIAKYEDIKITKNTQLFTQQGSRIRLLPSEYTLKFPDGFTKSLRPYFCEEYDEYRRIFECAIDFSYKSILPQARENLNAGESLEFGIFHLNRDGIQYGEKRFLWTDGYFVEFQYHLGEFSTGTFKVTYKNAGLFAAQPSQHYVGFNNPLVFIDLLKSMNKLAEENILH
jgi:hypothetical protein